MLRVLLLSGGGAKIAWQVGILRKIGLFKNPDDRWWIGGVSAGAILGSLLAQESDLTGGIERVAATLQSSIQGNQSVFEPHAKGIFPFSPLLAWWRKGVFSTAPLKRLLQDAIRPAQLDASPHRCTVGVVRLDRREYVERRILGKDAADWVLASASFPVAFPPVAFEGTLWGDGGIKNNLTVNLLPSISEAVSDVTVVITSPIEFLPLPRRVRTLGDVAVSLVECLLDEVSASDLYPLREWAKEHPSVPFRILSPESPLPLSVLEFDAAAMSNQIDHPQKEKETWWTIPA